VNPNDMQCLQFECGVLARVISAYIKEVDEKPGACAWGSKMPFANLMAEFSSGAGNGK
jgi:actin related protein 2/3 complex, subunit 1A/1B